MRTAINEIPQSHSSIIHSKQGKIQAIVVDPSSDAVSVVCDLLEFYDLLDVIGRVDNVNDALGLVVVLKPDLVLLDVNTPNAHALVAAMMLSEDLLDLKIIAMSAEGSVPPQTASLILDVNAFMHKASLKREFLTVFRALFELPQTRCR